MVELDEDGFFADLGCGEGNVLVRAAEKFGSFCVGFEIDHRLLPQAKRNIMTSGLSRKIDVVLADLFAADISRFDVIYVYAYPTIAQQLAEKLRLGSKKGAHIIIYDYMLPKLKPLKTRNLSMNEFRLHKVYVYKF